MDNGAVASLSALRTLASQGTPVDARRIEAYLRGRPELAGQDFAVRLSDAQISAGASGGTVLFQLSAEQPWAHAGDYVLRFDLGDQGIFSQTSLRDQFEVMRAVRGRGLPTADAVWLDEGGEIVDGAPAVIMRRVAGASPSIQYLQAGAYVEAEPAVRRRVVEGLIGFAARLHALPLEDLGLASLKVRGGEGDHFIDREIRWAQAELHARFPEVESGERAALHTEIRQTLDEAAGRLLARAPRDRKPVLAHGDLTLANVMFDSGGDVAAVLDWELCHEGLAEEDIAYFIYAAQAIASLGSVAADVPTQDEILAIYRAAGGVVRDWDFAAALSAFRLATWGAIGMRRMPREFWPAQKQMWELQNGIMSGAIKNLYK